MMFANGAMKEKAMEGDYEDAPHLYFSFDSIGSDWNPGFGKHITEATDGIR
jgi:hypothetical protein